MIPVRDHYDVTVIGGGLSGLCAALSLGSKGVKTLLMDCPISRAANGLGGFARFSGAKFSLPPAGMGLLHVVGSHESLSRTVLDVLRILELDKNPLEGSFDLDSNISDQDIFPGIRARKYESIVLTPDEIRKLIDNLSNRVSSVCTVVEGECNRITDDGGIWKVEYQSSGISNPALLSSAAVFFAGGRTGSELLTAAGCRETNGRGLDLGVRVEFPNKEDLRNLRDLGPDAKILGDNCRTFCLNVPGKIFRYQFGSISIPGGVVADASHCAGNVGLLYRHEDKMHLLQDLSYTAKPLVGREEPSYFATDGFLGEAERNVAELFGDEVTHSLCAFGNALEELELLNWQKPHYIHLPLLDWYWPTFSMPGTFRSTCPGLYVLGDSSGHARGLLQAAASGYIAAQEYLA